jgi:hypothetical protein
MKSRAVYGPWAGGGCLTFATALKNKLGHGAKLVDVVEPRGEGFYLYPGEPHHVLVEYDGMLWDAGGGFTPKEVLADWKERLGVLGRNLRLEPHNKARAKDAGLKVIQRLLPQAEADVRRMLGA